MSRNEDYLDNLLTSVTDKLNEFDDDFEQNRESLKESYQTQNNLPKKTQSALDEIREENFMKEFENELRMGGTEDDFLREFEQELNAEAGGMYNPPQTDGGNPQEVNTMNASNEGALADDDFADLFGDGADSSLDSLLDFGDTQGAATSTAGIEDSSLDSLTAPVQEEALDSPTVPVQEGILDGPTVPVQDNGGTQDGNGQGGPMEAPKGMEGLEDIFGDILDEETGGLLEELGIDNSGTAISDDASGQSLDGGLEKILNESDDDALSEIDKLLDAGEQATVQEQPDDPLSMGAPDFSLDESDISSEDASKKKKKEKNPNSLFGRFSRVLFGTPAELDPEAQAEYEAAKAALGKTELSPEQLKEKKKQEKEIKKQQKKEAAEQKKQEKDAAKAEKAAKKASKPKKEKKPKKKNAAPKEPPLPKVPVMMMWILALSMMVLVFIGTAFVGYFTPVKESKEAFKNGDYAVAYTKLQGVKLRKADKDLLHSVSALAGIQTELDAYNALMEQKQYELALDALVRGFGRCSVHSAQAEEWNVTEQLTGLENKFAQLLKEQFNVSKRKARKLYQIKKRRDYTFALQEILTGLGLQ